MFTQENDKNIMPLLISMNIIPIMLNAIGVKNCIKTACIQRDVDVKMHARNFLIKHLPEI